MFRINRLPEETWREAVKRIAGKYGMEMECLEWFDSEIASGTEEDQAAFAALSEWDCLELAD